MLISNLLDLSFVFYKFAAFDLKYFDSLPPMNSDELENEELDNALISKERLDYLSQLPKVNSGGDRTAYILSSKKALKIARNMSGVDQNEVEFFVLNKYRSNLLPKVFSAAKDYSWIVVELVRPLKNKKEIEELTGIDGEDFIWILSERQYYDSIEKVIKDNDGLSDSYLKNPILKEIDDLINQGNLNPWELSCTFNLGKSASGHLVLLDVGRII